MTSCDAHAEVKREFKLEEKRICCSKTEIKCRHAICSRRVRKTKIPKIFRVNRGLDRKQRIGHLSDDSRIEDERHVLFKRKKLV